MMKYFHSASGSGLEKERRRSWKILHSWHILWFSDKLNNEQEGYIEIPKMFDSLNIFGTLEF